MRVAGSTGAAPSAFKVGIDSVASYGGGGWSLGTSPVVARLSCLLDSVGSRTKLPGSSAEERCLMRGWPGRVVG